MKNSLFYKYFTICSMCVLSSIIVLGGVLMLFATEFFERDRYGLLERSVRQASEITALTYTPTGPSTGIFKREIIALIYSTLSTAIDGDLLLTDSGGNVIYYMENNETTGGQPQGSQALQVLLAEDAVQAAAGGKYEVSGTLGGFYEKRHYIVGVPVVVEGSTVGLLYAASSTRGLNTFLISLLEMFAISAATVLVVAFVLIYFITANMVRPLKTLLSATHSFSKGDFTVRVPVSGYDELGQLSMAYNNMASTLATTESSRRSFVANVSHELKTPMTTIGGFVDGILDGTVPEEKRDQYLQIVSNEVKRLSRLVRSMLDSSRIEAGEMEIHPVLFDISELNRQTIFSFEQRMTEKDLQVEGLEADKIMVFADRDLMNQVIYNLVENAVKFVNPGGTISFHYRTDQKMTYVAIRNTGAGLEKEEVPQLFERFYKSDKSRSLNQSGVGLGLHIVRTIINYHRGEVVVRSAQGKYTEFEFSVPNGTKS